MIVSALVAEFPATTNRTTIYESGKFVDRHDFYSDRVTPPGRHKEQDWIQTPWLLEQNYSLYLAAGDTGKSLSTREKSILGAAVLSKTRLLMSQALGQHVIYSQDRSLQKCAETSFLLLTWSATWEFSGNDTTSSSQKVKYSSKLHRILLSQSVTIKPPCNK